MEKKGSLQDGGLIGGFGSQPFGFIAFWPIPEMRKEKGEGIARLRSWPLSRRSGCVPAWPYPPLRSESKLRESLWGIKGRVNKKAQKEMKADGRGHGLESHAPHPCDREGSPFLNSPA
jgi:hypothetical protein